MKITIRAIGKDNSKELKSLIDEYLKRLPWTVQIEELVCNKKGSVDEVKKWEGELLLSKIDTDSFIFVMDEIGKKFNSVSFANLISAQMNNGFRHIYFLIGGASGHSDEVRKKANCLLSLSDMTFAHKIVRLILAEQVYRAYTIIQDHPYHK
jgi:23S rRNA (pseudouridine1915-N3)-methyltransferase